MENKKSIEKRFVIGTVLLIIISLALILFFYLSNFARLLNYPKIFDKYILFVIVEDIKYTIQIYIYV